ncbi:helix-hairpin-helix domain-containing protein [Alsobacter sp. KACC 23698]|uniref:DNA-directed DNA polymerase n=1 Tax=Alsobacter sp. KACC 23698 TaxID=3149229 RepID=A0AAU7JEU8_9HYPH
MSAGAAADGPASPLDAGARTAAPQAPDNVYVADRLDETADLLQLQDANPFRVRAYRNAARTIRRHGVPVAEMISKGPPLTDLPGIGEDLAGKIAECAMTGAHALLRELRQGVPPFVVELLDIPGIGPKRAIALWRDLGVRTREQLRRAALEGRIAGASGLGRAAQDAVAAMLAKAPTTPSRVPIPLAAPVARALEVHLRAAAGVEQVTVAGSFRRGRETVGDLDVLATAAKGDACIERFCAFPDITRVAARGDTKATVVLRSGMQVDLRVVAPNAYGSALQYFTGSKAHSIALRRIAQRRGLKLNEYGVFRDGQRIAGETEESVYAAIGLPLIPPELRENRGEIEAALAGRLPALVRAADLRGDLHVHCALDDAALAEAFCQAAASRGWTYLGLVDQASRLVSANGGEPAALERALKRIPAELRGVRVLRVVECDITPEGALALPETLRQAADVVIAAVHSRFDLSRDEQTRRTLRALQDPALRILAQPSRRLVVRDAPYDVDMGQVIRGAAAAGVAVEISADPARLDIGDLDSRLAREAGVPVSLSCEATSPEDLADLNFALLQARRGWLEARHVLNARPWPELVSWLRGAARGRPVSAPA